MLAKLLDRTHLLEGKKPPYPVTGKGYQCVQQVSQRFALQSVYAGFRSLKHTVHSVRTRADMMSSLCRWTALACSRVWPELTGVVNSLVRMTAPCGRRSTPAAIVMIRITNTIVLTLNKIVAARSAWKWFWLYVVRGHPANGEQHQRERRHVFV